MYQVYRNVVRLRVSGDVPRLNKHPFVIEYVPDTAAEEPRYAGVSLRDGDVYGDDERLSVRFSDAVASDAP
jgi:hypothetical protein